MSAEERLRPTFLIVGAQKSGTTAMFRYLAGHPEIVAPEQKELNFFMCPSVVALGYDYYHTHFPVKTAENTGKRTFEASPNYLVSAEAPRRMWDYDPNLKLIILLRDPVKRAHSAWSMYQRFFRKKPDWYFEWMLRCDASVDRGRYLVRPPTFGESYRADIEQEMEAIAAARPIEAPFLRHGCYEEQVRAYLDVFPREQVYIESAERFRAETAQVLAELLVFLGLSPHQWRDDELQPVFTGDYTTAPPEDCVELLTSFYRARNQQLFALLGKEFPWK